MSEVLQDVVVELSKQFSGDELFDEVKKRMPETPDFYILSVMGWANGGDVEVIEE